MLAGVPYVPETIRNAFVGPGLEGDSPVHGSPPLSHENGQMTGIEPEMPVTHGFQVEQSVSSQSTLSSDNAPSAAPSKPSASIGTNKPSSSGALVDLTLSAKVKSNTSHKGQRGEYLIFQNTPGLKRNTRLVLRVNLTMHPKDKILKTDNEAERQMKIEIRASRLGLSKRCYETFPDFEDLKDPRQRRESCLKVVGALAKLPIVGFDEEC
jgi:hypothetical protein